jgi:phage terminase large subunit
MSTTYTGALKRLRAEVGSLVETHTRSASIESFSRYADDPVGFLRDVLKADPWGRQQEIALAVRDTRQVVVRSANSIGKDWLGARLALWWAIARGGLVILTGPTERQVRHVLFKELARAFRSNPALPGELFQLALRVGDEDRILGFTSDNADRLTGFHDPHTLIVITEGQGVEPAAYEAAQACATSETSRLLVLGNPLRPTGEFCRISRAANWRAIKIPASAHPNVVEGREVIAGAVTAEWCQNIAEEYGVESSQYRARVLAEFPDDGSIDALVQRSWLDRAVERHRSGALGFDPTRGGDRPSPYVVADIGRQGADPTCVGVFVGRAVRSLERWREPDLMKTAVRLHEMAMFVGRSGRIIPFTEHRRYQASITVDDAGVGGGVTDRLREVGARVFPFIGAARARNHERFANLRAESYFQLRDRLMRDQLALPADEPLMEELLATTYTTDRSGRIIIESKDLIRSHLGRSPDAADVVSMAMWRRPEATTFNYRM